MSLISARRALALVCLLVAAAVSVPSPVAADSKPTEAQRIISIAGHQLGDRYSFASTGPTRFDCSGFVYFVYKKAGLLDRIGGQRRRVVGYHNWFNSNGTVSNSITDAQPGDLLVWGKDHHTGIYIGDGRAISALINPWGVSKHRVNGIHMKLTAVLHVNLER